MSSTFALPFSGFVLQQCDDNISAEEAVAKYYA